MKLRGPERRVLRREKNPRTGLHTGLKPESAEESSQRTSVQPSSQPLARQKNCPFHFAKVWGATPSPHSDLDLELSGLIDGLMKDIRKCTANALAWNIKIGVHLHQWRDGLGREDWLQLLRSGRLPFSTRTAQTLARIGGHAALANPKHAFRLPDAVTVLNQLAKIPPTDLEQLIGRNEVSAATTLAEARHLATEHRAKRAT